MKRLLKKPTNWLLPEPEPVRLSGEEALRLMGGNFLQPLPPPDPDLEALDILAGVGYGLLQGDVGVSFSVTHYSPDSVRRAVMVARQLGFTCEIRNGNLEVGVRQVGP